MTETICAKCGHHLRFHLWVGCTFILKVADVKGPMEVCPCEDAHEHVVPHPFAVTLAAEHDAWMQAGTEPCIICGRTFEQEQEDDDDEDDDDEDDDDEDDDDDW
jgi:hypothetical protein